VESRESVVQYLRSLDDKELAEVFYAATRDRPTSDVAEAKRHWVVGDVSLEDGKWSLDVFALPNPALEIGEWADGVPICQWGVCEGCGLQLRSWAKQVLCSVCGSAAYGS
jgi:hypothetical protein